MPSMSPSPLSDPPAALGPPVGRVLGTADATPLSFWVAVEPGAYLQLDDVVVTRRALPDREPVTIAGVVTAGPAPPQGAPLQSGLFAVPGRDPPAPGPEGPGDTTNPGGARPVLPP